MTRAWVLTDYGQLAWQEKPIPEGRGLLLRVVATGICGSDLGVYTGSPSMRARWRPPLILGHEVAGVVEEGPPHLLGQAVAVHPAIPCGHCPQCRAGRPHLCPHRLHLGFHLPGGLAPWIRMPEAQLYPLPSHLPPWKGALAEPLAVALHAVNRAGLLPGEEVLLLGGGSIGALLAWILTNKGARVLLVEPNALRARALETMGLVERAASYGDELPAQTFPLVLDTVGTGESLAQALRATAPGGRVVVLGLAGQEAPLNLQDLVLGERTVLGSYLFTQEEFAEAIGHLGALPDSLVRLWPAEQVQEAFQALLQGRVGEPKVVLVW
ncbi:alcohol dehydrogenase catalytic domain-containing protein [Thermus sp. FJN-A]